MGLNYKRQLFFVALIALSMSATIRQLQVTNLVVQTPVVPKPKEPFNYSKIYDSLEDKTAFLEKSGKNYLIRVVQGDQASCASINNMQSEIVKAFTKLHQTQNQKAVDPNIHTLNQILYFLSETLSDLMLESLKNDVQKYLTFCAIKPGQMDDRNSSDMEGIIDTLENNNASFTFWLDDQISHLLKFRHHFEKILLEIKNPSVRAKEENRLSSSYFGILRSITAAYRQVANNFGSYKAEFFDPLNSTQKAFLQSYFSNITGNLETGLTWVQKEIGKMNLTEVEQKSLATALEELATLRQKLKAVMTSIFGAEEAAVINTTVKKLGNEVKTALPNVLPAATIKVA